MGKPFKDRRNWKEYNEELVIRGTFFFKLDFVRQLANILFVNSKRYMVLKLGRLCRLWHR